MIPVKLEVLPEVGYDQEDDYETAYMPTSTHFIFSEVDVITTASNVLVSEELFYRQIEDWMCFTRNKFDCFINDEPHQAVTFLICLVSGQFLVRVWDKTVSTGYLLELTSIRDKIKETFAGKIPCTGLVSEEQDHVEKIVFSDFPYSRMISNKCRYLHKRDEALSDADQFLCKPCLNMGKDDDLWLDQVMKEEAEGRHYYPPVEAKEEDTDYESAMDNGNYNNPSEEEDYDKPVARKKPRGRKAKSDVPVIPCDLCSQQFNTRAMFSYHKRLVHLMGKYSCKICLEEYKFADDLLAHSKEQHPESGELPCTFCGNEVSVGDYCDHLR